MAVTLVKEDGTGLDDANSYTDRTFADTYHENKGRAAASWDSLTNAEKDSALIRATEYLDLTYGKVYKGSPLVDDQALEWPRYQATDRYGRALEEVPVKLAQATAELARIAALQGELMPRPQGPTETLAGVQGGSPTYGSIKKKREKVAALEEETEYTVGQFKTAFPSVHALMQSLIASAGGVYR
jgi:hypothetical protein